MGKIISIVGNLGAGKTTLTRWLCERCAFTPYWERPELRPFHNVFLAELPRWALANQVDFFLFRCQQEHQARQRDEIAVFDGDFDQDYQVYTRYLFLQGHLYQEEFELCKRFHQFTRKILPPPDLFIRLMVSVPTLLLTRSARGRENDDPLGEHELADFGKVI